jgi:hypothetical protein
VCEYVRVLYRDGVSTEHRLGPGEVRPRWVGHWGERDEDVCLRGKERKKERDRERERERQRERQREMLVHGQTNRDR